MVRTTVRGVLLVRVVSLLGNKRQWCYCCTSRRQTATYDMIRSDGMISYHRLSYYLVYDQRYQIPEVPGTGKEVRGIYRYGKRYRLFWVGFGRGLIVFRIRGHEMETDENNVLRTCFYLLVDWRVDFRVDKNVEIRIF